MIDFVTKQDEVLIIRDNQPLFTFKKKEIIEENSLYLIYELNSFLRSKKMSELFVTEEDEFMDLQNFVMKVAKKRF